MDINDIAADAAVKGGDTGPVVALGERMIELQRQIETLQSQASDKAKELYTIVTETLPEAMDSIGMKEFTLLSGEQIKINPIIKGSLPSNGAIEKASDEDRPMMEKRLADGLAFLRESGAGSLIKNILTFDVDKGKDEVVQNLIQQADELGIPHSREESIHNQTLNSWLKTRIEEGKPVPQDTFAIFNGRMAVVAKEKKKK